MTKIYFVRHCEAMGNVKRIFQGSTNLDISETGAKQLVYLQKRFADIKLDRIYSSPLLRAVKTACAVKGEKDVEIEICNGLKELHGGMVEGRPFGEIFAALPNLAEAWEFHPEDFAPVNGEPMRDAYERIWNTLQEIVALNEGKTVACVTHGGVTRCLLCRLLKNDIHELKNIPWSDNTAVSLIEVDYNGNYSVSFCNDSTHLPSELIPKRSRVPSAYINKVDE